MNQHINTNVHTVHEVVHTRVRSTASHEDVGAGVGQPEAHQPPGHQHGGGQQDGDGLGDAHQRAEDQVAQHGRQLAQGVAEAKPGAPGGRIEER